MFDTTGAPSLRTQFLARTLIVGLVPITVLAVVAILGLRNLDDVADSSLAESRDALVEDTVAARLQSEAESIGQALDLTIGERVDNVVNWSRQPVVIEGADSGASQVTNRFLTSELDRLSDFADIGYTDGQGRTADWVGMEDPLRSYQDEDWWQTAWEQGLHVDGVTTHPDTGEYVLRISSRIENDRGDRLGVLSASLRTQFVAGISDALGNDDLDVSVVTSAHQLLAETATGHDPRRVGPNDLGLGNFSVGIRQALIDDTGSWIADDVVYGYTQLATTRSMELVGGSGQGDGRDGRTWHVVTTQPTDIAFGPLSNLEDLNRELGDASRQLSMAVAVVLLFAGVMAVAMATLLARSVVDPLQRLTGLARSVAEEKLPDAVARLRDPDADDDPAVELPVDAGGHRELAELAESFNSVQETAIRVAGEQASQRRDIAEMFANLGRRTQTLVTRQLGYIDELGRSERDPDRRETLFKLDHLATRMRRNADSLLVLAGQRSPGRKAKPEPIEQVVGRAAAEVEHYERVVTRSFDPTLVTGHAVGDVAHILAEVVDNALAYSPPDSEVVISGRTDADAYVVSVLDQGIGMTPEELRSANEQLVDASLEVSPSKHLGLPVVAQLASRHDISVRLDHAESGGLVAEVRLSADALVGGDSPARPRRPDARPGLQPDEIAGAASDPVTPTPEPRVTETPSPPLPPVTPVERGGSGLPQRQSTPDDDRSPAPTTISDEVRAAADRLNLGLDADRLGDGLDTAEPYDTFGLLDSMAKHPSSSSAWDQPRPRSRRLNRRSTDPDHQARRDPPGSGDPGSSS